MNKFLKDLEKELKKLNVNPKEIKEILEDHKEMIEAAKQEGLNEDQISVKFGDPEKVASEIHQDSKNVKTEINLDAVESLAKFNTDKFVFVKTFNIIPEGLNFNISLVNDDFTLSDYDGEGIQVYQKDIKDIEEYEILLTENNFVLKRKSTNKITKIFNFKNDSGDFLVLMPKNMKYESFNYHNVSGDVCINDLSVNNFMAKSTSGDIELSNVNLGETKFSLVNGDVEIQGFKALSFDISLVNGDVELEKGVIEKDMFVHTVSGDIELNEVECDTATFKTVSGDIEGKNFYVNEISLKSVSGDVEIENDDKSREIKVVGKKTLSGDIKIN